MKVSKSLKKLMTLPNVLFVLASLMALSIICKDNISEGLKSQMMSKPVEDVNISGDKLPLGAVIVILVIILIIGGVIGMKYQ